MSELVDLHAADLVGARWRKSSYTASSGNCVEIADIPSVPGIAIRDSKNVDIPSARVPRSAWSVFLTAIADDTLAPR